MDGLSEPQRASLEAIYTKGMTSVALETNLNKIKDFTYFSRIKTKIAKYILQ